MSGYQPYMFYRSHDCGEAFIPKLALYIKARRNVHIVFKRCLRKLQTSGPLSVTLSTFATKLLAVAS
jgi:hypothetical protein